MNNPFRTTRAAIVAGLIVIAALFAGGFALYTAWQSRQTAKTESKLSKGQASAALESGQDAANTVGNRASADAATDDVTRENADTISKAEGANAAVAAPVRDAGRAALCRRAAYRDTPSCKGR